MRSHDTAIGALMSTCTGEPTSRTLDEIIDELRCVLHYSHPPSTTAALRGGPFLWVEGAGVKFRHAERVVLLRLCSPATYLHADVALDVATGLAWAVTPSGDDSELRGLASDGSGVASLHEALARVIESVVGRPSPSLIAHVARIVKQARPQREQRSYVPLSPSLRPWVERAARDAAAALAARSSMPRVARGLAAHVGLLTAAAHAVRRDLVCAPLPVWLHEGLSPLEAGPGTQRRLGSLRGLRARELEAAIRGLPVAAGANGLVLSGDGPCWTSLPPESLLLLYWLLALAPVHLVQLPPPLPGGDSRSGVDSGGYLVRECFEVVHGVVDPAWDADDGAVLAWSARALRECGSYVRHPRCAADSISASVNFDHERDHRRLPLFHGSASENAYSIVSNGLISLSGTRHEASGSIFGDGVYLTPHYGTALEFARTNGAASWAGFDAAAAAGRSDAAAAAAVPRPDSYSVPARWRAVVMCEAIADSANRVVKDGATVAVVQQERGVALPSERCYVVVPDPSHLRVRRLIIEWEPAAYEGGSGDDETAHGRLASDAAAASAATAPRRAAGRATWCAGVDTWWALCTAAALVLLASIVYGAPG